MIETKDNFQIVEIRKKLDTGKKEIPVFTTFYTVDNGYRREADRLIESLEKFGLPYYCEGILTGGKDWDAITKRKPILILKILKMMPNRNVVWLDADAIVVKSPMEFFGLNSTFACCYYKNGTKLNTTTMFFKNTDVARNICLDWIAENKSDQRYRTGDQKHLENVINRKYKNHTYVLPITYAKKHMGEKHKYIDGVIEKFSANTRLRNVHMGTFRKSLLNARVRPRWLRSWLNKWFQKLTRHKRPVPLILQ